VTWNCDGLDFDPFIRSLHIRSRNRRQERRPLLHLDCNFVHPIPMDDSCSTPPLLFPSISTSGRGDEFKKLPGTQSARSRSQGFQALRLHGLEMWTSCKRTYRAPYMWHILSTRCSTKVISPSISCRKVFLSIFSQGPSDSILLKRCHADLLRSLPLVRCM
jgi:hypothetical protein